MPGLTINPCGREDYDWCGFLRQCGAEGEALERALHDIGVLHHSGWAEWAPGYLTPCGAPVTININKATGTGEAAGGLSLRTEVADPASDPVTRVTQACQAMTALGGQAPDPALRTVLAAAQAAGDLTYGAWLDLHQHGRTLSTRLLAEIPQDATDLVALTGAAAQQTGLNTALTASGADIRAAMLAFDGTTGRRWVHYDLHAPTRTHLRALAKAADIDGDTLIDTLCRLGHRTVPQPYAKRPLRFAITPATGSTPAALTLYFDTTAVYGSKARAARQIARHFARTPHYTDLIARHFARTPHYTDLIATRTSRTPSCDHVGPVALRFCGAQPAQLSAHIAAPWSCQVGATAFTANHAELTQF